MRRFIRNVLKREEDATMCDNCGKIIEIEESDGHCPRCGQNLETVTSTPEDGLTK